MYIELFYLLCAPRFISVLMLIEFRHKIRDITLIKKKKMQHTETQATARGREFSIFHASMLRAPFFSRLGILFYYRIRRRYRIL